MGPYLEQTAEFWVLSGLRLVVADDVVMSTLGLYFELWERYAARTTAEWAEVLGRDTLKDDDAELEFLLRLLRDVVRPMEDALEAIEDDSGGLLRDHPAREDLFSLARSRLIELRTQLVASLAKPMP